MTAAELVRELQALPNMNVPVRVVLSSVFVRLPMSDWHLESLTDEDALEAEDVRYEGQFVLIRSA